MVPMESDLFNAILVVITLMMMLNAQLVVIVLGLKKRVESLEMHIKERED